MLYFILHWLKVDENMARAHKIEAASTQKFFFRKYMAPPDAMESCSSTVCKRVLGIHQTYISHVPTAWNPHLKKENSEEAVAGCIAAAAVEVRTNIPMVLYFDFIFTMYVCMYVCMYVLKGWM